MYGSHCLFGMQLAPQHSGSVVVLGTKTVAGKGNGEQTFHADKAVLGDALAANAAATG